MRCGVEQSRPMYWTEYERGPGENASGPCSDEFLIGAFHSLPAAFLDTSAA